MTAGVAPAARLRLALALAPIAIVGVVAFAPLYDGISFAFAGGAGLVVGAVLAVIAWRLHWAWWLLAPVTVLVYLVISAPAALHDDALMGAIPTSTTLATAARGIVTSWKDALTAETPLDTVSTSLLVPLLAALVCAVTGFSVALRARRPGWALLPIGALAIVAIAFGTYFSALPIVQGVVLAAGSVAWLSYARRTARGPELAFDNGLHRRGTLTRSTAMAAGLLIVAAVAGVAAHGILTDGEGRDVLRNHIDPPFDIHEYASPLQSYRGLERDSAETVLFTVEGLPDSARLRIATLDAYNGTVFAVGATGQSGSGVFEPLRAQVTPAGDGEVGTATITVGAWSGVWVPDIGYPTSFSFEGQRAAELQRTTHYNNATFTAATSAMLVEGDSYTVSFVVPPSLDAASLGTTSADPVVVPAATGVPESVRDLAAGASEGAASDGERMARMSSFLNESGFFSHGIEDTEPRSLSGHGTARIDSLVTATPMVGDDEQYAVALALMARAQGFSSRVVMGFYPETYGQETYAFTAKELHVWTEVAFVDAGWVAFIPTPDASKPLTEEDEPPKRLPKPQVLQPPPAADDPVQAPATGGVDDDALASTESAVAMVLRVVGYVAGGIGGLLLLMAPAATVILAKLRRRRRRRAAQRAADRVSGAWDEVIDAAVDAGVRVRSGATRREHGTELESALSTSRASTLALAADAGVFGPVELSDAEVDEFWREVDEFLGSLTAGRSGWARWRARLSLRSLAARRRERRAVRESRSSE